MKGWTRGTTLAAVAAVVALACGGSLFSITLEDTAEADIPRGTILEELTGGLGFEAFTAMDLTQSQELQNQGVAPGDIEEAELTDFTLEAVSGDDLSFLSRLELYVEAPGLPRELVASGSDFPEGVRAVELDMTGVDLADYIVSESMTLTTDVTGNRPQEDTTVAATYTLRVGVTGQGACNQLRGSDEGAPE
jgi:hypothetical protein